MFDASEMMIKMKERAMEAAIPSNLPTKMKEKFMELSHKLPLEKIEEIGNKFRAGHKEAMEDWKKMKEQKATL